jgi:hypothetical protein
MAGVNTLQQCQGVWLLVKFLTIDTAKTFTWLLHGENLPSLHLTWCIAASEGVYSKGFRAPGQLCSCSLISSDCIPKSLCLKPWTKVCFRQFN